MITQTRPERRRIQKAMNRKVPECLGVEERDGVPIEVAESMLFTKGTKLTSTMRKNCMAARETVMVSTREPKSFQKRFAEKAKKASAAQLRKWAERTVVQRARVTRAYYRLKTKLSQVDPMKVHDIARANLVLQSMDVEAQRLDAFMAALSYEAEQRLINAHIK